MSKEAFPMPTLKMRNFEFCENLNDQTELAKGNIINIKKAKSALGYNSQQHKKIMHAYAHRPHMSKINTIVGTNNMLKPVDSNMVDHHTTISPSHVASFFNTDVNNVLNLFTSNGGGKRNSKSSNTIHIYCDPK
jgi:hypothetical protein